MPIRLKKILGSLTICAFLLFWIVLTVGISGLVPDNRFAELIFYAVMGLSWVLPVMAILSWIERKDHQSAD